MASVTEAVGTALDAFGADVERGRFAVALSGGVDSLVLLHALCRLVEPARLRALHIDHGLHPDSAGWATRCAAVARDLGVGFAARRLALQVPAGASLEAVARHARYGALAELLEPDEALLTAHHADDQLETLLLRLVRGAGVRGLGAIVPWSRFGPGYLGRPLLDVPGSAIRHQAEAWRLAWTEDPSNRDARLDRNYLRAEVLPALRDRWPRAARLANRTAARMREAQSLLDDLAELDLPPRSPAGHSSPVGSLTRLTSARERNALRALIARHGLPTPTGAQLEQLRDALRITRPDAQTCVRWPGAEARVYRQRLYLMAPWAGRPDAPAGQVSSERPWTGTAGRLELLPGPGAVNVSEAWARAGLELRFRRGGERLRARANAHSVTLKHWFQQHGIVPWMRDRIPLLYAGDELVAVADLWGRELSAEEHGQPLWQVRWTDHPPLA